MDFLTLALTCAPFVAPHAVDAIIKTESHYRPLAININAEAKLQRQPENIEEAVVTARWLLDNGFNIDLGLGQINSSNFKKYGLSIEDAFDPCKNLQVSSTIFSDNLHEASKQFHGEDALKAALSAYNTGSFNKGLRNGYVQKVLANMSTKESAKTPAGATPIPLIYGGKGQLTTTNVQLQDHNQQPAKLSIHKATGNEDSESVYSREEAEENSIYVYSRPNKDVTAFQ